MSDKPTVSVSGDEGDERGIEVCGLPSDAEKFFCNGVEYRRVTELTEDRLAAALDAFNRNERLGRTEAMRAALEAARL